MKRFRYIGPLALYRGQTALGQYWGSDGPFVVQVDNLDHQHSHHWWSSNRDEWEEI